MAQLPGDLLALTRNAVRGYWQSLAQADAAKADSDKQDVGRRGSVTAGTHLEDFTTLIEKVVKLNGFKDCTVHTAKGDAIIPGYFRATKNWDLLVKHGDLLVAAIELKSMGSSFGNNTNNRAEEVLGVALDFDRAFKAELFGKQTVRPFLGYCVLLADDPKADAAVKVKEPHFDADPIFDGKSYKQRFEILCQRLVQEKVYDAAAVVFSEPVLGKRTGAFTPEDGPQSFATFCRLLAEHVEQTKRG